MSLQPNGQVLDVGRLRQRLNSERLWDPHERHVLVRSRTAATSSAPATCSWRTVERWSSAATSTPTNGLADTTIFDSKTDTYTRGPDMSVGRWYPTATVLPDGRVLAFAGDNIVQDRPGAPHPLVGRVGQLAPVDLQPEDAHLDRPDLARS